MLNITKGKINRAQKVVIYGPEGIGKSSLAARFPDPVIIDTEGGTAHMDVRRIDKPQSWEELLSIVKEVAATPGICKTLVIDTADAELIKGKRMLIVDDVISTGESLHAMEELVKLAGGIIAGKMAVLAEGDAQSRDDIIVLAPLPLFNPDGSVKA